MAPQDGAIRAMIGGFDYNRGTFNRATQAWRQPGSNIKPFVYAAALERGLTPATQISDQPFMLTAEQTGSKAWSPKNDGNRYEPMLTLRQGLMRSKNMVSIRILQAIGPQYAQDYLTRFGFDKARWPVLLALGAGGATPLQVVNGYSVFANGGYRVTPFLIDRVTDRSGHVLMQAQPWSPATPRAPSTRAPPGSWTASCATPPPAAPARARTSSSSATTWAARRHHQRGRGRLVLGFTPTLATTVWMGFDQPRSLGTNDGSGLALSTWLTHAARAQGRARKQARAASGRPAGGQRRVLFQ